MQHARYPYDARRLRGRTGFPNAGKSTLLNRLVGQKLAITSAKAQSTRQRVVGIRTENDTQMVVLDTPGLLEPRDSLHSAMRNAALAALCDAPVTLLRHAAPLTDTASNDPLLAWRTGFTRTYGAELRAERGDRPDKVVDFAPGHYVEVGAAIARA
ncbi:GTPase, partial [Gemmatimonas sp.]|uniref:GTPase n=1 Tax=Gemmatimonas sp. TaxID=1962908 RepID=UPI0031F31208